MAELQGRSEQGLVVVLVQQKGNLGCLFFGSCYNGYMNELSELEKAKREISLLEHAITFVSIAGQTHQRMYHTDEIPANYLTAIDLLNNQLSTAKTRLKQIETLES